MAKNGRLPPRKRTFSVAHVPTAAPTSSSHVSASNDRANPFVKHDRADAAIAHLKQHGTRNKNAGFEGISKRKRVRLDKREKKKLMAIAGKLKCSTSKVAQIVPLEIRAKADAAKERERKKRQKLKKKRMQLDSESVSAPASGKKRRSRSQVASDAALAAAAAVQASSLITSSSHLGSNDADSRVIEVAESVAVADNVPSKKMLRKLLMKGNRLAAKAVSPHVAVVNPLEIALSRASVETIKHNRVLDAPETIKTLELDQKKPRSANNFPYQVDSSDHAETPSVAYADIVPVLSSIAESIGKSHNDLIIFDPFYCQGSVRCNLAALGFKNVINKKQDFYSNPIPDYDVLLTNPPYSGDHLDNIVQFAARSSKPWLLLLPNFVVGRLSYAASISKLQPPPFYIVPAVRYAYIVPSWAGAKVTAPFASFWYAHCAGPLPPPLAAAATASMKLNVRVWRSMENAQPLYIEDIKALPQDVRDVTDPLKKRPNPRARKRMSTSGAVAMHSACK